YQTNIPVFPLTRTRLDCTILMVMVQYGPLLLEHTMDDLESALNGISDLMNSIFNIISDAIRVVPMGKLTVAIYVMWLC
ncbi:hypothetical protein LCGC14_3087850, partial [marine sediment metagenome]